MIHPDDRKVVAGLSIMYTLLTVLFINGLLGGCTVTIHQGDVPKQEQKK
jgi:ABC-type transporter Mla maintaining outer membrane lipid asymmetry permease subunit MlaE